MRINFYYLRPAGMDRHLRILGCLDLDRNMREYAHGNYQDNPEIVRRRSDDARRILVKLNIARNSLGKIFLSTWWYATKEPRCILSLATGAGSQDCQ